MQQVDVIIAPSLPVMAPDIGSSTANLNGTEVDLIDNFIRFTGPSNLTGLPALNVPVGLEDDLPVGLQIIGRAFDVATVIQVGSNIVVNNTIQYRRASVGT